MSGVLFQMDNYKLAATKRQDETSIAFQVKARGTERE